MDTTQPLNNSTRTAMKIRILSDLHVEREVFEVPPVAADVVILAGDIHNPGIVAVRWALLQPAFGPDTPILFVAGNHEYYRRSIDTELEAMQKAASGTNVHVLQRSEVILGGVRFLGTTMWTDFQLPAHWPGSSSPALQSDVSRALAVANESLNDCRLIEVPFTEHHPLRRLDPRRTRHLTAEDTLSWHWQERSWLLNKLREPFAGPTVVITHHAPSIRSVHPRYAGDPLNAAFASELDDLLNPRWAPKLWVHGHMHDSSNYWVGTCNVVANPRGYLRRDGSFENAEFDPRLVVELDVQVQGAGS